MHLSRRHDAPFVGNRRARAAAAIGYPRRIDTFTDATAPMATEHITHHGRCHCDAVAFSVDAPAALDVLACNCSICRMTGYLHLIVPRSRFRLLRGDDALIDYRFGTGTAIHRFCRHCGIKAFYVPRSHPDGIDVNVRCLDPVTITQLRVASFDDNDRAAATAAIAHLADDAA